MFRSADSAEEADIKELQYPTELLNLLPGTASISDHRMKLMLRFMVTPLQNMEPKNDNDNGAQYVLELVRHNVPFHALAP